MSLDYGYIFSQIDKAKKKRKKPVKNPVNPRTGRRADGSIPWNSPLSRKVQTEEEEKTRKKEEEIERTGGRVSQRRYKDPKDRKPGEKPGTYREGTNVPYKDEKEEVVGGRAINAGTTRRAHSRAKLTNEERAKRKKEIADGRKLTPQQREEKKRRVSVGIGDLNEDGKISDKERELLRQKPRKPFDIEAKERKTREQEAEDKKQALNINIASGVSTLSEIEVSEARVLAEAEEKKRERQRKRTGKKPGIDPEFKEETEEKKTKKKRKPKEDKVDEETDIDTDDDYVVDYSDDEDSDVGPIGKALWKSWLEKKDDFDQEERDNKGRKEEAEKEKEKYKLREFSELEKLLTPWRLKPPYLDSDYVGGKKPPTPTDRFENLLLDTMAEDKEDKEPPKGVKKPHSKHKIKPKDAAWKSWLKNKVSMTRMKEPEDTRQEKQEKEEKKWSKRKKLRRGTIVPGKRVPGKIQTSGVKVDTKEGESWEKFKERQNVVEDPKEYKTLTERIADIQDRALRRVQAQNTASINASKKKPTKQTSTAVPPGGFGAKPISLPAPKPKPATKKPTSASKPKPAPKKEEPAIKPKEPFADIEREARDESKEPSTKYGIYKRE